MNGKQLQKIIRQSGMTQKAVAELMEIHPTQFTTYFKQDSVTSEVLEKVAQALGMTMGQLYGETPVNGGQDTAAEDRNGQPDDTPSQNIVATKTIQTKTDEMNACIRSISVAAMQGILANATHSAPDPANQVHGGETTEQTVARAAIRYARALIEEFKQNGIVR